MSALTHAADADGPTAAPTTRGSARPLFTDARRAELLDSLNAAVRRPELLGGAAAVVELLNTLAAADPDTGLGTAWIPDTASRTVSTLLRGSFGEADAALVASQYGEDAHRRGWLRLDRALGEEELGQLLDRVLDWSEDRRRLADVLAEFGEPSVVYGDPAPDAPKTLAYTGEDREARIAVFHLGAHGELYAVRIGESLLGDWTLTPAGQKLFV
ncbi:hypothetical protein [Kitasatospora griseola]|uniref:hypothetical protein n=1 Tax=Kitasatospora griseola TaxID=2064 RepID=UPI0016702170|nr:hypothetical protein [Kitasatospora griseola]GGQ65334.1 hypothetical protein GCM10010195_21150 [Kitasatospora griseola]